MSNFNNYLIAAIILLLCPNPPSMKQQRVEIPPNARAHIQDIISSLPSGTPLRRELEAGAHGDGVHETWMDTMQEVGVKKATVSFRFTTLRPMTGISPGKVIFYRDYGTDCSQIRDEVAIKEIQKRNLDGILEEKAIALTSNSGKWISVDNSPPDGQAGVSTVTFFDYEWLSPLRPLISMAPSTDVVEAIGDESALSRRLQSGNWSKATLNQALLVASGSIDDSCILKPLLKAGADPNTISEPSGNTALMNAAATGQITNARVLLESGADPKIQDRAGRTALSMAKQNTRPNVELVKLLEKYDSADSGR